MKDVDVPLNTVPDSILVDEDNRPNARIVGTDTLHNDKVVSQTGQSLQTDSDDKVMFGPKHNVKDNGILLHVPATVKDD